MKNFAVAICLVVGCAVSSWANDCRYWNAQVDPSIQEDQEINEEKPENVFSGIECLLRLQGNEKEGFFSGSKDYVSQILPKASVEIDALYYISQLFYGNDEFADAVALVGSDKKLNSKRTVKKAYVSYRNWFVVLKRIGLPEARRQKLDPLKNSTVRWY